MGETFMADRGSNPHAWPHYERNLPAWRVAVSDYHRRGPRIHLATRTPSLASGISVETALCFPGVTGLHVAGARSGCPPTAGSLGRRP